MKNLPAIIFLIFTHISCAQEFFIVNTKTSSGINFPAEYFSAESGVKNFTVTENEIKMIEDLLYSKILENRPPKDCIASDLPGFMCKNLKTFKRQYFGFYLGDQKMVCIKFIQSKNISTLAEIKKWKSELWKSEDGFAINYNIEKKEFYELGIL